MASMATQHVQLTIEDVLSIHRQWIIKLYVEEYKTEAEIVDLLYDRRLPVTWAPLPLYPLQLLTSASISQIRDCLRDWNSSHFTPSTCSSSSASTSTSTTDSNNDDWPVVCSHFSSSSAEEPQFTELYTERPLPSVPSKHTSKASKDLERRPRPTRQTRDLLKIPYPNRPSRPYEVEITLDSVPKGPSPLQIYALDQQSHEMLAVGLNRVPSLRT